MWPGSTASDWDSNAWRPRAFSVLAINCQYKRSSTFADTLDITIGVKEVTPVKFTVEYTMKCKDKLCCIGTSTHCFIAGGRPVSLEQRLPELYAELTSMVKG